MEQYFLKSPPNHTLEDVKIDIDTVILESSWGFSSCFPHGLFFGLFTWWQEMNLIMNIMVWVTQSCPPSSPGSLLLSIPVAVYQRLEAGYWFGPQTYCSEVFPSARLQRAFIIYSFLAVYLMPLLTITACYAFMLKRMGQPSVNPIDSSYQVRERSGVTVTCFFHLLNPQKTECVSDHYKPSLTPASGSGRASSGSAGTSLPDGGGDGGPVPHLLGPHPGLHPPASFWPPQLRSIQGDLMFD